MLLGGLHLSSELANVINYFVSRCFMKEWQISIIFCLVYSLESIFSVSKICCG